MRRWAVAAATALGGYVLVAAWLPDLGGADAAVAFQGLVGLLFVLTAALAVERALPAPRQALVLAAAAVIVAAGAALAGIEAIATPARLVAAVGVGFAVAHLVETARQLAFLAVLAALVDVVSVVTGPTGYAADRAPALLEAVGLRLVGWRDAPDGLLGAVDVALLTLFIVGARRTGLRDRRTALLGSLAVAVALVASVVFDRMIPAILAIAVAFLGANATAFSARSGADGTGRA